MGVVDHGAGDHGDGVDVTREVEGDGHHLSPPTSSRRLTREYLSRFLMLGVTFRIFYGM